MRALLLMAVLALVSCKGGTAAPSAPAGPRHLRLLPAPPTEPEKLAEVIAQRARASKAAGRTLVVYVGAAWCEPCQRFHQAAEKGQLDAELGDLDLLVFDADLDAERLLLAGYESQLIPLLVLPGPDGRATDRRMEGSVKGDAVGDMVPRLKRLLGR